MIISTAKYKHYLATIDRMTLCRREITAIGSLVQNRHQGQLATQLNILRLMDYSDWNIGVEIDATARTICVLATVNYVGKLIHKIQTIAGIPAGSAVQPVIQFEHSYNTSEPQINLCSATPHLPHWSNKVQFQDAANIPTGWANYQEYPSWSKANNTPHRMPEYARPEFYQSHHTARQNAPELAKCLDLLALWPCTLYGLNSPEPKMDSLVPNDLVSLAQTAKYKNKHRFINNSVRAVASARIVGLILNSEILRDR